MHCRRKITININTVKGQFNGASLSKRTGVDIDREYLAA